METEMTPAASKTRSGTLIHGLPSTGRYQGTCQCCFNGFITKAKSGRSRLTVVLHGYERPGHGYIQGKCQGENEEPFELAKNVTEAFRDRLAAMLANTKGYLARLKADKVDKLVIEVRDESVKYSYGARATYKSITIGRDYKVAPGVGNYRGSDFETHRQAEIHTVEGQIRQISANLDFVISKLATWKYNPAGLIDAETRASVERATKTAARKAIFDVKEAHEEAIFAAFISNEALVTYLKGKPHVEFGRGERVAPKQTEYDYTMSRIASARSRDIFGARSYSRRRIISDLRDAARNANIKVKTPKWSKEAK